MTALVVGAARADITPPVGIAMGGWSNQVHERSDGNDLGLNATVLTASSEDSGTVVVAELDLCLLTDEQATFYRCGIADGLDIAPDAVRITATHNHSGPVTGEITGSGWIDDGMGFVEPYLREVGDKLAQAAKVAFQRRQVVTIGYATSIAPLGENRRELLPDGRATSGHNPSGPVDHTVRVARFDGPNDVPVATVVHYSAHPTIMGGGNRLVAPDYPGVARRVVESAVGGVCLFLQGTPGDIGPRETFVDDVEPSHRLGNMLGHAAASAAFLATGRLYRQRRQGRPSASSWIGQMEYEPQPTPETAVRLRTSTVLMPLRSDMGESGAWRAEANDRRERLREARRGGADASLVRELVAQTKFACMRAERAEALAHLSAYPLAIHAIRLGPLALIGLPIEPFIDIGRALVDRSPFPMTMVSGYTNGYRNYLPTREAWPLGGYEVDISPFTPDGADLLTQGVLEAILALQ